jgi:protein-S-isoprenylcysteine O-methyltransferase Ste14
MIPMQGAMVNLPRFSDQGFMLASGIRAATRTTMTGPGPHKTTAGVVPPPLIALAAILGGLAIDRWIAAEWLREMAAGWRFPVAGLFFLVGAQAGVRAILAFRAVDTEVEPWKPSTALATASIYRRTRNPMYQGIFLIVLALGIGWPSAGILLLMPVLATILHVHVVRREEAYLERLFGADYRAFRAAVPRYGWPW